MVRAATQAERQRLVALRADGTIGDAAFQRVEEESERRAQAAEAAEARAASRLSASRPAGDLP